MAGSATATGHFFFTDVDPEIALKDSRDPLGMQPVWGYFGRQLVGNLTTVTTSVRGFTTLILGHYLASELVRSGKVAADSYIEPFLRFEQMAAYSRIGWAKTTADDVATIRGIRRAHARLAGGNGRVRLSADQDGQILSSQKTYGLWGLYSVAAINSGLVLTSRLGVSSQAQRFIEQRLLPIFERHGAKLDALLRLLAAPESYYEPREKHASIGRALAEMHRPVFNEPEKEFYVPLLVEGTVCKPDGIQAATWRALREYNERQKGWNREFGMRELEAILGRALVTRRVPDAYVSDWLGRIRIIEQVLAPAEQLFGYILQQRNQRIAAVDDQIRCCWNSGLRYLDVDGIYALRDWIDQATSERACEVDRSSARLVELARVLRDGQFEAAIRLVIGQNKFVMNRRGGAAWAEINGGRIKVIYSGEAEQLIPVNEAPSAWRNTYFLNALKSVGGALLGRSA